jgi:hypothetical protein
LLGIAALDRVKWRQRSRITWLREGDANTKLFHLRANGRRRKNHIPTLKNMAMTETVSEHEEKAAILLQHYTNLMGTNMPALASLNWEILNLPAKVQSHLEAPFSMDELKAIVDGMHGEKAPGPTVSLGTSSKSVGLLSTKTCLTP